MNFQAYFPIHINLGLVLLADSCTIMLPRIMESFTLERLDELGTVDQVRIFINDSPNSRYIKIIDDPKEVDLIVKTFKKYSHGWRNNISPYSGPLSISFFHKGEIQFDVTIGYQRTSNGGDGIYSLGQIFGSPGRPLTNQEFKELIQVLGIEERFVYFGMSQ